MKATAGARTGSRRVPSVRADVAAYLDAVLSGNSPRLPSAMRPIRPLSARDARVLLAASHADAARYAARHGDRHAIALLAALGDVDVDLVLATERAAALDVDGAARLAASLGRHVLALRAAAGPDRPGARQDWHVTLDRITAAAGALLSGASVPAAAALGLLASVGSAGLTWRWLRGELSSRPDAAAVRSLVTDPALAFGPDLQHACAAVHPDARAQVVGHELCRRRPEEVVEVLSSPVGEQWAISLGGAFLALARRDEAAHEWLSLYLSCTVPTEAQLEFALLTARTWPADLGSLLDVTRVCHAALAEAGPAALARLSRSHAA